MGFKHLDKETLNQLLIDSGWEGLKEMELLFFITKKIFNYLKNYLF